MTLSQDIWKINVPLRDEKTMEYLWQALRDGNLDCLGTDHVDWGMPREAMDKGNVWETSSGFPSRVESYLPVMLTEGVHKNRISLERLVELCCENPARIFGLYPKKGSISVGADADLVLVDLDRRVKVQRDMIYSSAGWSIWEGQELRGWPVLTMLRGQVARPRAARDDHERNAHRPLCAAQARPSVLSDLIQRSEILRC